MDPEGLSTESPQRHRLLLVCKTMAPGGPQLTLAGLDLGTEGFSLDTPATTCANWIFCFTSGLYSVMTQETSSSVTAKFPLSL